MAMIREGENFFFFFCFFLADDPTVSAGSTECRFQPDAAGDQGSGVAPFLTEKQNAREDEAEVAMRDRGRDRGRTRTSSHRTAPPEIVKAVRFAVGRNRGRPGARLMVLLHEIRASLAASRRSGPSSAGRALNLVPKSRTLKGVVTFLQGTSGRRRPVRRTVPDWPGRGVASPSGVRSW